MGTTASSVIPILCRGEHVKCKTCQSQLALHSQAAPEHQIYAGVQRSRGSGLALRHDLRRGNCRLFVCVTFGFHAQCQVNVVDAVERKSSNTTTFDWYVGHLSRKRLGEVVVSEPIFAGGCFWRVHFYPQGIVSQDFTSLYIESVEASKEDCPLTFKAFLTVKIFIDPEIVQKSKATKKESKSSSNDDLGDSASQVGSVGGSEQGSQASQRSGSAAGSRASRAGSSLSKSSRLKSQASRYG